MPDSPLKFRFDAFEVDPRAKQLHKHNTKLKLHRQSFEVLLMLVEHPGEVVTREEVRARLWPQETFVDFEHSVNTAINKVRQALSDSPDKPRYIETVPRVGYRFLAPVEKLAAREGGRVILVVLPFENLSGDPAQEYFSDGLTEETITDLSLLASERLGIIARTSAMRYKGTKKSIAEIGDELDADYALEGSVRREGNRVRISAQLIRTRDQTHLWAKNYDRELQDILAVQDDLGREIARQTQVALTPRESSYGFLARVWNPEAYDAYLRGRSWFHRLTRAELLKSAECFERAVEIDSEAALAHAGLAMVYATLPITSDFPSGESFAKAKTAARRALALDDKVAEAHVALCSAHFWYDWDWAKAEEEGRKAIGLDSNSAWAHLRYAHVLSNEGKHAEAIEEIGRARLLDPLSLMVNTMSGMFRYQARRYEEAMPHFLEALELNPKFWVAHINLAKALHAQGRTEEALAEAAKARETAGGSSEPIALEGYFLARLGRRAEAEKRIGELEARGKENYVPPYNFATVYLGLEDAERSIEWLERGFTERDVRMVFLGVDPKWDALRSDQRFQDLLRRVGFA
ncbi:MAG TPA: winged helix-turn-helix domain-containing protein [Candidatus Acidoferrales bacterium]|nr:winged helix-turn-helix domain-containing protein [Candidatus Acidoferrales bacterium]